MVHTYTKNDLETDLNWFDGLGVSRLKAKSYLKSLFNSKPNEEAMKELKR